MRFFHCHVPVFPFQPGFWKQVTKFGTPWGKGGGALVAVMKLQLLPRGISTWIMCNSFAQENCPLVYLFNHVSTSPETWVYFFHSWRITQSYFMNSVAWIVLVLAIGSSVSRPVSLIVILCVPFDFHPASPPPLTSTESHRVQTHCIRTIHSHRDLNLREYFAGPYLTFCKPTLHHSISPTN